MTDFRQARQGLVQRILKGKGTASHAQRRAAFDNAELEEPMHTLIEKVARHSERVTRRTSRQPRHRASVRIRSLSS